MIILAHSFHVNHAVSIVVNKQCNILSVRYSFFYCVHSLRVFYILRSVFGDSICAILKNPNSRAQEYFVIVTSFLLKEAEACNED